jgi:hypothetical protein
MSNKTLIKDIIIECFPEYMHNRVGTSLKKSEHEGLSQTGSAKLIKGKLVAYMVRYDEYIWAIYNRDVNMKKEIIIKHPNNIVEYKEVFMHSLVEHIDSNNIAQVSEKTYKLTKESLIDSYKLE